MGACLSEERLPNSLVTGAQNNFIALLEGVTPQYFGVQTTRVRALLAMMGLLKNWVAPLGHLMTIIYHLGLYIESIKYYDWEQAKLCICTYEVPWLEREQKIFCICKYGVRVPWLEREQVNNAV